MGWQFDSSKGLENNDITITRSERGGNQQIAEDSGHSRLQELGYKQELKRDLSVLANFAFSFSIISILTGITTLYTTGLTFGGPVTMVYGWLIAGCFTLFVGLSMAEICSSYPTSGGLYYWSARLSGKEWGPFAAWMTGWFNIVGQWAVTTSVDFSLAQLIQVIILLCSGGMNGGGYKASKHVVIGFHGGILLLHAILNSLPIRWLSFFGTFAAAWNVLVSGQRSCISGHGLNCHDWFIHCICLAYSLPYNNCTQNFCERSFQSWPVQYSCRLGSCIVGGYHHGSVLSPCVVSSYKRHPQLYPCRSRWTVCAYRWQLDSLRQALVPRTRDKYQNLTNKMEVQYSTCAFCRGRTAQHLFIDFKRERFKKERVVSFIF